MQQQNVQAKNHPCHLCYARYASEASLKQHLRRDHQIFSGKANVRCNFASCTQTFIKVSDLRKHLSSDHQIDLEEEQHVFDTLDEFYDWKLDLEYLFLERYVKASGDRLVFNCRRKGFQKRKRKKDVKPRKAKPKGSIKMNGHCSSQLVVNKKGDKFHMTFYKTHVGHDSKVCHSSIDRKTKSMIYGLLLRGLEPAKILEKLQSKDEAHRNYYLKLRDILNIQKATSIVCLENGQLHEDDATSVKLFVEERCNSKDVIIYKPNRVLDLKYPELIATDFVIGLMTDTQVSWCDLLENEFSVICIDATHGMGNGFKMITIMTINEFYQGIPLAFCISRTETATVLQAFFEAIKKRVGKPLHSKYFMSDDAEYYFTTWKEVMDPNDSLQLKHWLCTWHVNQAWKKNLKKKVQGKPKQDELKKRLYDLKYETNQILYDEKLAKFHEDIGKDPEFNTFYEYLVTFYFPRIEKWAFVFRDVNCLTTNTHLEAFHKTFKKSYLKDRSNVRVDFNLEMLLRFIENKKREYKTAQVFGLNNRRNAHVLTNHSKAESEITQWCVESHDLAEESQNIQIYLLYRLNGNETYALQNIKDLNNIHPCFLSCNDCKICFHHYTCSCNYYLVNHNLCKHVHLLRMLLAKESQNVRGLPKSLGPIVDVSALNECVPQFDIPDVYEDNCGDEIDVSDNVDVDTDGASECPNESKNTCELQVHNSTLHSDNQIETKERLWTKIEFLNTEFQGQLAIFKHQDLHTDGLQIVVKQLSRLTINMKNMLCESTNESTNKIKFSPRKKSSKRKADHQIRLSPKTSKHSSKQRRKLF